MNTYLPVLSVSFLIHIPKRWTIHETRFQPFVNFAGHKVYINCPQCIICFMRTDLLPTDYHSDIGQCLLIDCSNGPWRLLLARIRHILSIKDWQIFIKVNCQFFGMLTCCPMLEKIYLLHYCPWNWMEVIMEAITVREKAWCCSMNDTALEEWFLVGIKR